MSAIQKLPRTQREIENAERPIDVADHAELLKAWRELMQSGCSPISPLNWINGLCDTTRFSEHKGSRKITFAWRAMLIGYQIGVAAARRSNKA